MVRTLSFLFVFFGAHIISNAQGQLEIGAWQEYMPYKKGKWVTQGENDIYYATDNSILQLSKAELTPTFIGKLQGLSDVGVERIDYDIYNDQLIIAYTNSNIDIYTPNIVYNLPDIRNNRNIVGSRKVNDIHVFDKQSAFLATGFGLVELDLIQHEFQSTVFTEQVVNDITSSGDRIYIATDMGIYTIRYTENTNISDFSKWSRMRGISEGTPVTWVEVFDNNVYAVVNGELLEKKSTNDLFAYVQDPLVNSQDVQYINRGNDALLVGLRSESPNSQLLAYKNGNATVVADQCLNYSRFAIQDESGRYWFADEWGEFRYRDNNGCHRMTYNSPNSDKVSDIEIKNDILYVASGGVDRGNWNVLRYNRDGLFTYDGTDWSAYNQDNVAEIRDNNFFNVFQVATHPKEDKIYFGSFFDGLIEQDLETETSAYFDERNSKLSGAFGSNGVRISGLVFDDDETLWVNCFEGDKPLAALDKDGNWYAYYISGKRSLAKCIVDQNGYIWSMIVGGSGVHVYDANGTLADPTDDRQRIFARNNSLIEAEVQSLAVDLDGQIWVGTDKGPVIFSSAFDDNEQGTVRKVLQDSIAAILLETENILSIAIDGGNQKWFGTRNGIFVQSSDGETQIARYTTDNSPLNNNTIKALTYDGKNGLMYIGTEAGLQVIRTNSLSARRTHAGKVYAFPNPVRSEHRGEIYIKGLARDAIVKITDLNGKLVYQTQANGGLASWNGKDVAGNDIAGGVYLVFSTGTESLEDPDSFVTKIMVIR